MKSIGLSLTLGSTTVLGWVRSRIAPNPDSATLEYVYRGVRSNEAAALAAIKAFHPESRSIVPSSVSDAVSEFRVIVDDSSNPAGLPTPEGDARSPTFEVIGIDGTDTIYHFKGEENLKRVADINRKIKTGEITKEIEQLKKDADESAEGSFQKTIYSYVLWQIAGVTTKRVHSYNVNMTRFLKLSTATPANLYQNVGKVISWNQLPIDKSFQITNEEGEVVSLVIPEPMIYDGSTGTDSPLQWLIRQPSLNVEKKWIRMTQTFLGALRYPDFYPGGSWDVTKEGGGGNGN